MVSPVDDNEAALPDYGRRPDDHAEFRLAQLLLLLEVCSEKEARLELDRLGVVDFLAANPFLLISDTDRSFHRLRLAGFGAHSLTYAAPGHRFATRRSRLQHDIALLVAYGLATVRIGDGRRYYTMTESGALLAGALSSTYADAYRLSAAEVLNRVRKLSDRALRREFRSWLRADPALFELLWQDVAISRIAKIGARRDD